MKRILSSVLAIALCLSLFSGCHQKHGDNKGKRLPVVMTIAEARPGCAVFEYKDGNPYCFYAYDDNGKLYRVFWNHFEGLKERDRIVVDHNDTIITLNHNEYPSLWTPQYEITAICIYTEEEWKNIVENTSPAEYFQVQKNDHGVIVFSVVAGFPQAKYTYRDLNGNNHIEIQLDNKGGEVNSLLFDLLNGKSTVPDNGSKAFTDCISMTCSYTSDDGSREITVVYEFKWSSVDNTVTICRNNALVGAVLLSDDEMHAFKNDIEHLSNRKKSQ